MALPESHLLLSRRRSGRPACSLALSLARSPKQSAIRLGGVNKWPPCRLPILFHEISRSRPGFTSASPPCSRSLASAQNQPRRSIFKSRAARVPPTRHQPASGGGQTATHFRSSRATLEARANRFGRHVGASASGGRRAVTESRPSISGRARQSKADKRASERESWPLSGRGRPAGELWLAPTPNNNSDENESKNNKWPEPNDPADG